MRNEKPDLRFGPGTNIGFTPSGVSAFDNLRPAAVVRELIQNSLDAARAGNVVPAVVRFQRMQMERDHIPGIKRYATAFRKASETQRNMMGGDLASQAKLVVKRIENALSRPALGLLCVLDNGIGLNEQRMNALLSDGVSAKEGNATGTYGNGHSTAIPASDLRYVLYGGITMDGRRIGAGHAVLASHTLENEPHVRAGDGFYIRGFNAGKGTLYDYASDNELPDLIANALDRIEADSEHGSAVIVPAFNDFLEDDSLWEMVSYAAAANFFVAIEDGELEVTVEDTGCGGGGEQQVLNRSTLSSVLETFRDRRRAAAFLNGRRAFEAHWTYQNGARKRVSTAAGDIEISLRENATGTSRIDLCRNGMWITNNIPGFYQKFTEKVPFHAVLSLNAEDGRELHDFIRTAEGPLHDAVVIKRLPEEQRRKCRRALEEIRAWLLKNTASVQSDAYVAEDFLTLDFGDGTGGSEGKGRTGFWGVPMPTSRRPSRQIHLFPSESDSNDSDPPTPNSTGSGSNPPNRKRRRPRPVLPTFFQAASRPAGKNRRRLLVECMKHYVNAELRLVVDEALDATCERHGQDAYAPAVLSNITVNGAVPDKANLSQWDGEVIGIRLGDLREGESVAIETDYCLTGDFTNLPSPSLRVEILSSEQHPCEIPE